MHISMISSSVLTPIRFKGVRNNSGHCRAGSSLLSCPMKASKVGYVMDGSVSISKSMSMLEVIGVTDMGSRLVQIKHLDSDFNVTVMLMTELRVVTVAKSKLNVANSKGTT